MARFTLASVLLVLCLTQASAQETYDLRKLKKTEPKAGEKFRETEREDNSQNQVIKNQGQVMQQQDQKEGFESARIVECVETDEKGKPTKIIITFESYKILAPMEKTLEVAGLKLEVTRGADGKYTAKHLEGPEVPAELKPRLDAELEGLAKDEDKEKKKGEAMLPAEAVAVGQTWDLDMEKIVAGMGIPADGLDKEKSSGQGVIKSFDSSGPVKLLNVEITMKMTFNSFQGMKCLEPLVWDFVVKAQMSADGSSSAGGSETAMTMVGSLAPPDAPPGMTVSLNTTTSQLSKRVLVE